MIDDLLIPISALNQYTFCPRRCWYMHVAHEFLDNAHTVEGTFLHERVDAGEATRRGDLWQVRSVQLYSTRYGLTGKADLLEEQSGEIYPVEYKKGRRGEWSNDQIQLCAQALALEEMLGRDISRGFLYYARTGATPGSTLYCGATPGDDRHHRQSQGDAEQWPATAGGLYAEV